MSVRLSPNVANGKGGAVLAVIVVGVVNHCLVRVTSKQSPRWLVLVPWSWTSKCVLDVSV